jgi:ABC-2 type transport system ATP-binding protein
MNLIPRPPAIELSQLTRKYKTGNSLKRRGPEAVALDSVDLIITKGEVHGLLGPNGAGKSTLCKILATVLLPTSGSARVLGHDIVSDRKAVQRSLGLVLGGERGLYYRLTARQNLRFWGALYGLSGRNAAECIDTLLEKVGLRNRADDAVHTFSRGMKQRLHLARGLLPDPEILLLDEPTYGMDPVATRDFHALIEEFREEHTILITTHDMDEAERLCDRVTLLNSGRVLATEPPRTLATWITRFERVDARNVDPSLVTKLEGLNGVGPIESGPDGDVRINTIEEKASAEVLRFLLDHGHTEVRTSLPSLEEVYVHVFGQSGSGR